MTDTDVTAYWIEDEPDRLNRTVKKLRQCGIAVSQLLSASEAIGALETMARRPGAIILDLKIPRGDGAQLPVGIHGAEVGLRVLEMIKHTLPAEPIIIVLSGNLDVDIIKRLRDEFQIPTNRVFTKPLMSEEAEAFISEVEQASRGTA